MCFVFVLHVFVCILLHIDAVTPITVSWLLHAYFNSKLGFFSFCFFLFNTYYLLSNENPLFVILSIVACFFTQSSILYYSFFPHFTLLFTFSFRVKFVWYLWFIVRPLSHNHLSHFIIWFTRFKIVHHRLRLVRLYLQKYSLTLIIEISRFLMSRLHNLLLPLVPYTLVYYSWWSCLGELKDLLSDETKVTPRKGWDLLVVETSFNVYVCCCLLLLLLSCCCLIQCLW